MSPSDRPTGRPDPVKKLLSINDTVKKLIGVLGTMGLVWAYVSASVGSMTTDLELTQHDVSPTSHAALTKRIEYLEASLKDAWVRLDESREVELDVTTRVIRLVAVYDERDARKRAIMAYFYQEEFLRLVEKEKLLIPDACRRALDTPYRDRSNSH